MDSVFPFPPCTHSDTPPPRCGLNLHDLLQRYCYCCYFHETTPTTMPTKLPACLPAVPIGKPITTIAHNTSATSLYISWKPPPPDTILGEFLGYRITYRTRDKANNDLREMYIRESNVEVRNDFHVRQFSACNSSKGNGSG